MLACSLHRALNSVLLPKASFGKDGVYTTTNGVAKHKKRPIAKVARALMSDNKDIAEIVHALMSEKNMPPCYWAEAAFTAVYTINVTPTAVMHDMTPEEKFIGKEQDVFHFKFFGCIVYVHVLDGLRTKLDPKAEKYVFIGYFVKQKGYKCYNPITQVRVSRDVVFDEIAPWYSDVKDDLRANVNNSVAANLDVQSQVLSGPQGSLASSHVANS
ncbi:hypothetical protein L7F22_059174 [Adiantum nelumboides]|nr:hypothetical protein [Adiantum nelumboides]